MVKKKIKKRLNYRKPPMKTEVNSRLDLIENDIAIY